MDIINRRVATFFVVALFILTVGYFAFRHYPGIFLPLPIFVATKRIYGNVLAMGFILLLPVLTISKYPDKVRALLLIFSTPLCFLCSYMALDFPEKILASSELNSHRYYVTMEGLIDESYAVYSTYRCNQNNLACEIIYSETSGSVDDVVLIADQKMKELHVLRKGRLRYTDGEQARMILENEEYGGFIYSVATPPVDVYYIYGSSSREYTYMLYKCKISFTECQKLPFHYTDSGGSFRLTFNVSTNELEMSHWKSDMDEVLIYSYGTEPKCYVDECVIPNE